MKGSVDMTGEAPANQKTGAPVPSRGYESRTSTNPVGR